MRGVPNPVLFGWAEIRSLVSGELADSERGRFRCRPSPERVPEDDGTTCPCDGCTDRRNVNAAFDWIDARMGEEVTVDEPTTWRELILPSLPSAELEALLGALERNDPTLVQGATTEPALTEWSTEDDRGQACQATCPLVWGAWRVHRLRTVGQIEIAWTTRFNKIAWPRGNHGDIAGAIRWYDVQERDTVRAFLTGAVHEVLKERREREHVG